MSILDASLRKTWDSLRARKQVQEDFLDEVRLKGLRGIRNLRVAFDYPLSVIAGPNGCGKSTVLFACAAAYAPAGRRVRAYTPAALFPGFSNGGEGGFVDEGGFGRRDRTGVLLSRRRCPLLDGLEEGAVVEPELHGPEGRAAARAGAVPPNALEPHESFRGARPSATRPRDVRRGGNHARSAAVRPAHPAAEVPRRLVAARAPPGSPVRRPGARPRGPLLRVPHVGGRARHPADVEGRLQPEARADPHRRNRGRAASVDTAAAHAGAAADRLAQRSAGGGDHAQPGGARQRAARGPHLPGAGRGDPRRHAHACLARHLPEGALRPVDRPVVHPLRGRGGGRRDPGRPGRAELPQRHPPRRFRGRPRYRQ